MSYRNIKRLLGETSLERKCRLILGGGIFLLILGSFFVYGYQTEKLVWDQTKLTAQLLVQPFLLKRHPRFTKAVDEAGNPQPVMQLPMGESILDTQEVLPEDVQDYRTRLFRPPPEKPNSPLPQEYSCDNQWDRNALLRLKQENLSEVSDVIRSQKAFRYMGAVRLHQSCMQCHPSPLDKRLGFANLKQGDLMAAVSIRLPLEKTELAVNANRAILLSFAIGTAILAMSFVYVIIRYIIVKPVAHLQEVSEEIASGNLTVRASIQTGDEFQELSHAFNRMLRSLVSMQDELRKVNTDLDAKLDELARANMALFEMNRLKSDFLATMSHELRTPLNSILGFGELLAELKLDPRHQKWVQNIQNSGKLLLAMINDILDLAKLEAGKMQVRIEEFSLRDLVEGLLQMTRPLADKKHIVLEAEVDPAIPILKNDSGKLQQILSNLLSNAIKFTPEGGRITLLCRAERGEVVLSVVDNGVGIAPEDQTLVFEKFRQAESSLTREHGGTGLGLSIVRELTKLLGGDKVSLESELGRGSTFTIRLPFQLTTKGPAGELTLGDDGYDFSKLHEREPRFYTTSPRPARLEAP